MKSFFIKKKKPIVRKMEILCLLDWNNKMRVLGESPEFFPAHQPIPILRSTFPFLINCISIPDSSNSLSWNKPLKLQFVSWNLD